MSWHDGFQFELTEDEKLIQSTARQFASESVAPFAKQIDRQHAVPQDILTKLGELGFFGVTVPEKYGGSNLSQVAYALIVEELAAACASTSVIVSAHNSLAIEPILKSGSEAQLAKFIPGMAAGKTIGCFALSEPGTGSDAASLTCVYETTSDGFLINGTKNWITNGPIASVCVLFAKDKSGTGSGDISAFVHQLPLPGVSIGKAEEKLGVCGSPTSSISYDNVKLPKEALLGPIKGGFKVAMQTLNGGRIGIAAQAVGIARAALAAALAYSKERKTFGQAICNHQTIQNYLAEMICDIDAGRYLTLAAAKLKESGKPYIREAAMAKLFASEMSCRVADLALQIHGGYGYVKEFPVERHLRDARITRIYEGTSEIQKFVIAGQLLK